MRVKALTLGIDLSKYDEIQEADILRQLLQQHEFQFFSVLVAARNLGGDRSGSIVDYIQNLHSPWMRDIHISEIERGKKELEEIFDKNLFVYSPYNILAGGPAISVEKMKDES